MAEHHPCLIQQQIGWLTRERALEPVEQVEQNRDQIPLAHGHQVLDFEDEEPCIGDAVCFRIEQPAKRAFQCVVPERGADRFILNVRDEMRERSVDGLPEQHHR